MSSLNKILCILVYRHNNTFIFTCKIKHNTTFYCNMVGFDNNKFISDMINMDLYLFLIKNFGLNVELIAINSINNLRSFSVSIKRKKIQSVNINKELLLKLNKIEKHYKIYKYKGMDILLY